MDMGWDTGWDRYFDFERLVMGPLSGNEELILLVLAHTLLMWTDGVAVIDDRISEYHRYSLSLSICIAPSTPHTTNSQYVPLDRFYTHHSPSGINAGWQYWGNIIPSYPTSKRPQQLPVFLYKIEDSPRSSVADRHE